MESRQEQVIAIALDPRTKWLYKIMAHEHDIVWNIISHRLTEIATAKHRSRGGATASSPISGFGPAFPRDHISESKQPLPGFITPSMAQARNTSTTVFRYRSRACCLKYVGFEGPAYIGNIDHKRV